MNSLDLLNFSFEKVEFLHLEKWFSSSIIVSPWKTNFFLTFVEKVLLEENVELL